MRYANILNDYAFKFVFGEDNELANAALKGLVSVFLGQEVKSVIVKNPEIMKSSKKMKSSKMDLLVEFENGDKVDLEMQAQSSNDDLASRFGYYMARLHGQQDMEGKLYSDLNVSHVLIFLNVRLYPDEQRYFHIFQYRDETGMLMASQEDKQQIRIVEMPKVDQTKSVQEMDTKEKVIYYFLNCQKGMEDAKIKEIVKQGGVVSMIEKRVEQISDDYWQKLNEDFDRLAENERMMQQKLKYEKEQKKFKEALEKQQAMLEQKKTQLEQKDAQLEQKDAQLEQKDAQLEQKDAQLEQKDAQLEQKDAQLEQRDAQLKMKDKLIEEQNNLNKLLKEQQKKAYQQMIDDGFSVEQIAKYFSKDDIQ